MKTRLFLGLALLALIFVGIGCNNGPKPEVTYAVNGTYAGTVKSSGQTSTMAMSTTQSTTNQVSGTYTIGSPLNESGTVSGSILGLIFNMTLKRTLPTAATFSTSVDISNGSDKLTGSYGTGGAYVFDLTRK